MQTAAKRHAAYQLPVESLDVVVVEDSKPMQMILRSVLSSMRVARVRTYDSPETALQAMLAEPPNLIITDWKMSPISGYQLLRMIRHRNMGPLCFVPVLFVTAHGTRERVEKILSAGAHHLLVKPLAPSALYKRLLWLIGDSREFVLDEATGFHTIAGVESALVADRQKRKSLLRARVHHQKVSAISEREAFIKREMAAKLAKAGANAISEDAAGTKKGNGSDFAPLHKEKTAQRR